ncbi:hypothetical protein EI427_12305 [Flammeovirga pectinis]|uniref:Outer membrane protein beta-barrel domain-containing protein n=1 Tax=Flammeovirga pectinis TaxID=2494373 RepID=A0A3Q9FMM1_9BACT|nr:hypothetical protein [Flammeovirga pectinis]AZQ62994.1 hypothetical protein EI427_12305 [Flammeovirga pectinis]
MNKTKAIGFPLLMLLSFVSTISFAQEEVEEIKKDRKQNQYILLGSNFVANVKSRDAAFSPLTYSGMGIGASGGYLNTSDHFEFLIDGGFNFGLMYTDLSGSTDTGGNIYYTIPVHTHALWKINPVFSGTKGASLKLGGAIDFLGNYRGNFSYTNSALNFEYISGFGLGGQLEWDVSIGKTGKFFRKRDRDLTFLWSISLPLMGSYMRPSYNTISDFTTGANFLSGGGQQEFAFIGKLVQFQSRLEMYYKLHNLNAFRLQYEWKYYAVNEGSSGTSKGAYHRLGLAFMFNVTGNKK